VLGHGRKYLTAIIEIDFDTVADWARANDVTYTGFTSLTEHPRIETLIKAEIEKTNVSLARVEQIKSFRILPKALDPEEEGEPVTPTRKIKRKLMYERFQTLVEAMYDHSEERLIAAGTRGDGLLKRLPGWRLLSEDRVPGHEMHEYVSGPAPLKTLLKRGALHPMRYDLEYA